MKKGKLLALALAGAITLMGAGYAAWSDNVNINATVSTAKFDVDIEDVYSYVEFSRNGVWNPNDRVYQRATSDVNEKNDYGIKIERGVSEENKKITYKFENLFPGSKAVVHFKMLNNSSIPLIINDFNLDVIDLDTEDGLELDHIKNTMYMSYAFNVIDKSGKRVGECYSKTVKLKDARAELDKLINYTLESGHMIEANDSENKTGIWLYLPPTAGNEFQNKGIKFDIDIEYAQFNAKTK